MKRNIVIVAMLTCSVMLVNCTPSSEKRVETAENKIERDIKKEKEETIKDLRTLRDDTNAKLDKISKKLDGANATTKTELEAVKEIFLAHRDRVQVALDKIDNAADDSWDDTQQAAKNTVSEVSVDCERVSERFETAIKNTDN